MSAKPSILPNSDSQHFRIPPASA